MKNQELSDQEILDALQEFKMQKNAQSTQAAAHPSAEDMPVSHMPAGKPSLTEILAREGLIEPQETSGQLDPTVLQVILDL